MHWLINTLIILQTKISLPKWDNTTRSIHLLRYRVLLFGAVFFKYIFVIFGIAGMRYLFARLLGHMNR